jgi:divalent metal cation (Fe/Co/Zn/Cd) transporter
LTHCRGDNFGADDPRCGAAAPRPHPGSVDAELERRRDRRPGHRGPGRALRVIAAAFVALAIYLLVQTGIILAVDYHPKHSLLGIVWAAVTAAAMFVLAYGKDRTGKALGNPVLTAEARVTVIDGLLASAVLIGLALNAGIGWWWADPAAGLVIVYYAIREARTIYTEH